MSTTTEREMHMKIEIGKTYICRDGSQFHAEALTRICGRTYDVQGRDERGRVTWRSIHGRFAVTPHRLDVVREAVVAKKELGDWQDENV
jgi:hypothetical protein